MICMGIETSCDETSVALVRAGRDVLSNIVASSLNEHSRYGGVVPEIASRMQLELISAVCEQALKKARIKLEGVDLVAVTRGPGLPGSLLVGLSFAKALSLGLNKPLLGINHIHSHIYANFLSHSDIRFPVVALVVSGGHTSLLYLKSYSDMRVLGQTQDDACGEAFDKVAKIIGLGYPGGPLIEKMAEGADSAKVKFSCSGTRNELDFSFSGTKTAVLYYLKGKKAGRQLKKDVAASFQESVIRALVKKSLLACRHKKVKQFLIGGGVAANSLLRQRFRQEFRNHGIECYFPPIGLCMDNAAMVAGLACRLYKRGFKNDLYLNLEHN